MSRPEGYNYLEMLKEHLGGSFDSVFNGKLVYPRQLEIHLPGDLVRPCNFNCYYCQGGKMDRILYPYEEDVLCLLDKFGDDTVDSLGRHAPPVQAYGGQYSEPLLNPYLLKLMLKTKEIGCSYGLHTNGSLFLDRENKEGFLTKIVGNANSSFDYITISLDAGKPESHQRIKNTKISWFETIIDGIAKACEIRGSSPTPAIRIAYLMTEINSSFEELSGMVDIAKKIGVDSLRFSIPYDNYGKEFGKVRQYKEKVELRCNDEYKELIKPLLSGVKPVVFYISPESQDVDRMIMFKQCIYPYYQTSISSDGYIYRCSSTASPNFAFNRVSGRVSDDMDDFHAALLRSQDKGWKPSTCFKNCGRCNRLAVEINSEWMKLND